MKITYVTIKGGFTRGDFTRGDFNRGDFIQGDGVMGGGGDNVLEGYCLGGILSRGGGGGIMSRGDNVWGDYVPLPD